MNDSENLWTFTSTIQSPDGTYLESTITVPESRKDVMECGEVVQMVTSRAAIQMRNAAKWVRF